MKRVRKTKPFKQFNRRPQNRCVICLYQIGFSIPIISEHLRVKPGNVLSIVFRAGTKRGILNRIYRRKRVSPEGVATRLIMRQYREEMNILKRFDEFHHWWTHPVRVARSVGKRQRKDRRKSYQTRLVQELARFRCQICGRDASVIPLKRRRCGLKYCSAKCREKAGIAAEKLRLESNPELRQRKREALKRHYYRTRRERPEVYQAKVRRKLANPLYRIAKSHRARLQELIGKGVMMKTQTSLRYFGCTIAHLKQHLESQFKPGMTWQNYGKKFENGWEVDHIIPLSKFNLMNSEECARALNWQNLQPLFFQANREKSNKVIDAQSSLPLVVK